MLHHKRHISIEAEVRRDHAVLAVKVKQGSSAVGVKLEPLTELYVKMATTRAADAAVEAIRDLKAAKLSYNRSFACRISFGPLYS